MDEEKKKRILELETECISQPAMTLLRSIYVYDKFKKIGDIIDSKKLDQLLKRLVELGLLKENGEKEALRDKVRYKILMFKDDNIDNINEVTNIYKLSNDERRYFITSEPIEETLKQCNKEEFDKLVKVFVEKQYDDTIEVEMSKLKTKMDDILNKLRYADPNFYTYLKDIKKVGNITSTGFKRLAKINLSVQYLEAILINKMKKPEILTMLFNTGLINENDKAEVAKGKIDEKKVFKEIIEGGDKFYKLKDDRLIDKIIITKNQEHLILSKLHEFSLLKLKFDKDSIKDILGENIEEIKDDSELLKFIINQYSCGLKENFDSFKKQYEDTREKIKLSKFYVLPGGQITDGNKARSIILQESEDKKQGEYLVYNKIDNLLTKESVEKIKNILDTDGKSDGLEELKGDDSDLIKFNVVSYADKTVGGYGDIGFYGGITNKEIVEAFKIVENKKDARSKIKEAYEKEEAEIIIEVLEQCGIIEKETAKPQEQTNTDADSNQQEQASEEQADGLEINANVLESDGVD